jgi:predicted nucleotidyltransferase
MDRKEVVERLKMVESEMRELGVNALFLFGSYALDEADDHSGIDIVVEFGMETAVILRNCSDLNWRWKTVF